MGYFEDLAQQNATTLAALVAGMKNYEQLDNYAPVVGEAFVFTARDAVNDKTYHFTEVQFINLINSLNNKVWFFVEGSDIKKETGVDITLLEADDIVRFKPITNDGFPVVIPYGTYDGGDKQLLNSYTLQTLVI